MSSFTFRVHAIQRMFARNISEDAVKYVVLHGEIIKTYPDDTPYPSRLMLGWVQNRPLHVVVADNPQTNEHIIITTYQPDKDKWDETFKIKKDES